MYNALFLYTKQKNVMAEFSREKLIKSVFPE